MTPKHRAALVPLTSFLVLSLIAAGPLSAQQPQQATAPASVPAPAAPPSATPAPAPAPAPHQSSLYSHDDGSAPTIAAAQKEHAEAMRSRNHTIVVSTTVIVLSAIILVLLIA